MSHPPSSETPVFIYGALRSGTTVFRLMLDAHEGISNPGEVDFLFDFLRPDESHPSGWRYDLDSLRDNWIFKTKELTVPEGLSGIDLLQDFLAQFRARAPGKVLTLNVHRHAERIAELMPEARFIHLLRDPRDVARSSIGMGWAGLSYFGIDHWIRTERSWDAAAIPSDQVLTLKFEGLMADIEPELTCVCTFLGVPFSNGMLDYHLDTTYGPPDPRLAEQWRRKAAPREIALLEGKAGKMIAARGYAQGAEPHHPGPVERAVLAARNATGRWRASIRRFGLPLLLSAKLSHWLHARSLHRHLRRRMEAKIAKSVK